LRATYHTYYKDDFSSRGPQFDRLEGLTKWLYDQGKLSYQSMNEANLKFTDQDLAQEILRVKNKSLGGKVVTEAATYE